MDKIGTSVGVKSKGFLAWAIRAITGTEYNHWYIVVKALKDSKDGIVKAGELCIAEAIEAGICYTPINHYEDKSKYTLLKRFPVNPIDENIVNNEALNHLGNPYDVLDLTAEQPLFIETGLWIGGKSTDKWICVKFCLYLLYKASGNKYFENWYEDNNIFLCDTDLLKTI